MKRNLKLYVSLIVLATFALWTVLVKTVDVQGIGPNSSLVGFAALNGAFYRFVGVNMTLYTVTDWLGLVPIGVALGFAVLGLVQTVKRRSPFKVDGDILLLGAYYAVVIAVFVFFECVVINYRPVLIEGRLEASYPSSTTLLVTCVMPTASMQMKRRVKNPILRRAICLLAWGFTAFMVAGRIISGVHWITDIIGGVIFSVGAVMLYAWVAGKTRGKLAAPTTFA